jgi:ribosomal protein L7Ae-like RNA K-turn-binding protein
MGLREVNRYLDKNNLVSIIIAPDIERVESDGGLDFLINNIIKKAKDNNVFIIFALNRKLLGKVMGKAIKISIIGIVSIDGAISEYKNVKNFAKIGRRLDKLSLDKILENNKNIEKSIENEFSSIENNPLEIESLNDELISNQN